MSKSSYYVRRGILESGAAPAVSYLFRDTFTTDQSTSTINGSAAEPGIANRTAIQTDGQLAITGGQLSVTAQASAAWGDLSLYYSAPITRAAGKIVSFLVNTPSTNNALLFGLGNGSGGSYTNIVDGVGLHFINGRIGTLNSSGASVGGWNKSYVTSENIICYVVLRANGYYLFTRQTTSSVPITLAGFVDTGNTANLYPMIAINQAATGTVLDDVMVPDATWLPSCIASDSFNRADGALGNTDGAGHLEGGSGSGKAWTDQIGTLAISTNKAMATATTGSVAISTVDAGTHDVVMRAALTRGTGTPGIVVRYLDSNNYVYAVHDGTNAKLIKRVDGTETTVATAAAGYAAGRTIFVSCQLDSFQLVYNNALVSTVTISDHKMQLGTKCGLYFTDTDSSIDNFILMARGMNDEYASLNTYIPNENSTVQAASFSMSFDDGKDTDYTEAFAYMNPLGLKGTSFVIYGGAGSGQIGEAGVLSLAQCQEMYAAGWAIGNHTSENLSLSGLSQAVMESHLSLCRAAIDNNIGSRASRHVAYPSGYRDATSDAAMVAQGMLSGRTTVESSFRYATVIKYQIPVSQLTAGSTITAIETTFYNALLQRKSVLFFMHKIGSGGGSEVTQAVFRQIIDFIVARGLTLYTIDEMYSRM